MRVHFICRGNVNRSIMAEAYLVSLNIPGLQVVSSGIVADEYAKPNIPVIKFVLEFLESKGLKQYVKSYGNQLVQSRIYSGDTVICMNQRVFDECQGKIRLPKSTIIWNVDDTGESAPPPANDKEMWQQAEETFQKIKNRCDNLMLVLQLKNTP